MRLKSIVRAIVPSPIMEWVDRKRYVTIHEPLMGDVLLPILARYTIKGTRGFYIECGANDGIDASNTVRLERFGWRGLLIEPAPSAFEKCRSNRAPNNIFVNCALVSDPSVSSVKGDFDGSGMASIGGIRAGRQPTVSVPARTLQSILDEHGVTTIDFFSLDVEGFELEVLRGLDLTRNPPSTLLIEVLLSDRDAIFALMRRAGYSEPQQMTKFDKRTHPRWDGTHQDYFFVHQSALNSAS